MSKRFGEAKADESEIFNWDNLRGKGFSGEEIEYTRLAFTLSSNLLGNSNPETYDRDYALLKGLFKSEKIKNFISKNFLSTIEIFMIQIKDEDSLRAIKLASLLDVDLNKVTSFNNLLLETALLLGRDLYVDELIKAGARFPCKLDPDSLQNYIEDLVTRLTPYLDIYRDELSKKEKAGKLVDNIDILMVGSPVTPKVELGRSGAYDIRAAERTNPNSFVLSLLGKSPLGALYIIPEETEIEECRAISGNKTEYMSLHHPDY